MLFYRLQKAKKVSKSHEFNIAQYQPNAIHQNTMNTGANLNGITLETMSNQNTMTNNIAIGPSHEITPGNNFDSTSIYQENMMKNVSYYVDYKDGNDGENMETEGQKRDSGLVTNVPVFNKTNIELGIIKANDEIIAEHLQKNQVVIGGLTRGRGETEGGSPKIVAKDFQYNTNK